MLDGFPYWPKRDPITSVLMCQNCWNGMHGENCQHDGCRCPCSDHKAAVEIHEKNVRRPRLRLAFMLAGKWLEGRE